MTSHKRFVILLLSFNFLHQIWNVPVEETCNNKGLYISVPNNNHHRGNIAPNSETCEQSTLEDVQFLLYTRQNRHSAMVLSFSQPFLHIKLIKPIKIIVHGWISSPFYYGIQPLKDAYLERDDSNVILLDWSQIAHEDFMVSVCKIPSVAKLVAELLCNLESNSDGVINKTHIMGHSLGGHLVGFVGKYTKSICNQTVGRITGLDPGGFAYQNRTASGRLDKSDALFVDVLHTNMGVLGLGYFGNLGQIDYYINCGEVQPGCLHSNPQDEVESIRKTRQCSHFRVLDLMAESILNSNGFVGVTCKLCPSKCNPDQKNDNGTRIIMGQNYYKTGLEGAFYVQTKQCPPYALP